MDAANARPITEDEILAELRRSAVERMPARFTNRHLYGLKFGALLKKAGKGLEKNLAGADFRYAKLCYADLSGFNLENADFTGAWLDAAKLCKAKLNGANLQNAVLTETDVSGAEAFGVDLRGACLGRNKRVGAKGDTKLTGKAASGGAGKLKKAAIASAEAAAATCELEGLDASDPDALEEAAEDLWHHAGVPDLEAKFGDDEDLADEVEAQGSAFRKAAVAVLKARLKKAKAAKKR